MIDIAATTVLALVFLVPGYFVHRLTRVRTATFLLSFSWSWMILIGCVAISGVIGLSNRETLTCYLGVVLMLLIAVVVFARPTSWRYMDTPPRTSRSRKAVVAWLLLMVLVTLYQSTVGVYLELPADVYAHLDHMKEEYAAIAKDRTVTGMSLADLFDKTSRHWYRTVAWIAYFLDRPVGVFLESLALVNVLMLVSGIYWFALSVFSRLRWSLSWKLAVAISGSIFFIVCHGTNVFSFVRYYALAPIATGLVIQFAVLAMFIAALRARVSGSRYLVSGIVLCAVAAAIHLQAAGFVVVTVVSMSLVVVLGDMRRGIDFTWLRAPRGRYATTIVLVATLVIVAAVMLSVGRPVIGDTTRGLLRSVSDFLPFMRGLRILNPTYQFYQVLALWGCVVLGAFFVWRRRFRGNAYLLGAMAVPLLTVFNPLFVEIYIRFQPVETLWRFAFVMPLPLVGGYLLIDRIRDMRRAAPCRKILPLLTCVVLVGAVLPVDTPYLVNQYSRISTLLPVPSGNDHRHWADLLEYLRSQRSKQVVTDPVTGYLISGLTDSDSKNNKFHSNYSIRLDKSEYAIEDFRPFRNWLLIVNLRDGEASRNGALSRHWSREVLAVSRHYSPEFLEFVARHGENFVELWARRDVIVYLIK